MLKRCIIAAMLLAGPAAAATNLIDNGSFEAGSAGYLDLPDWTRSNTPDQVPSSDKPGTVIAYGAAVGWPTGAYGEAIPAPRATSGSPDAAGAQGYYFVSDFSNNETISQLTFLTPGNYRLGFDYYLPGNGWANANNASFSGTIIGVPVVTTAITRALPARAWQTASGVAAITRSGWYLTSFVFSAFGQPAKDIVIDRVFAVRTEDEATAVIPPTPTGVVPEPQVWALLVCGFGMVGGALRRRSVPQVAA